LRIGGWLGDMHPNGLRQSGSPQDGNGTAAFITRDQFKKATQVVWRGKIPED